LDTIRDYGLDRQRDPDQIDGLAAVDEATLRARHRDFYLQLAERFNADWFGPRQVQWAQRMRAERENLRAALGYCLDTPGQQRAGLRLAGALYYFWFGFGEPREGRYWLERALPADPEPSREQMRALAAYGQVLLAQSAAAAAMTPARECIALAQRFEEPFSQVVALNVLGLSALFCDDLQTGLPLLEQAVTLASELADPHPEALAIAKQHLAVGRLFTGDPAAAADLAADSAAICRAHGDQWYLNYVLVFAVNPALALGEVAQAAAYVRESLQVCRALHDLLAAPEALGFLAWTAAADQDYPRAARLLGAADRQVRDIGRPSFDVPLADRREQCEAATRKALGDSAYDNAHRRGSELNLDDAVAYALGEEKPAAEQPPERGELPSLTRREREVAELVAQGLSNKEIAARLVIAQRTAESHVDKILSKLGFSSRAQVAAWYAKRRDTAD
jgi:ATP/maltotriose-dependent transcriptional regulator MalT